MPVENADSRDLGCLAVLQASSDRAPDERDADNFAGAGNRKSEERAHRCTVVSVMPADEYPRLSDRARHHG